MAFSEIELKRIDNLVGEMCRRRSPAHIRDQLRFEYEIDRHSVIMWEVRPVWNNPSQETRMGVAKFRYSRSTNKWKLYWMRADLKWHAYNTDRNTSDLDALVSEVEHDQHGAFFG